MNLKLRSIIGCTAIAVLAASCGDGYEQTDSGLKYKIHTENEGDKPKIGDFLTLHVLYKTETDSVFFDTRKYSKPIKVPLMKPSYNGSFEEGLAMLGAGDSATFIVSADSVFTKVFMANQLPAFIKKGSMMKIDVKIMDIETKAEIDAEVKQLMAKKKQEEGRDLQAYISSKKITAQPNEKGMYIITTKEGKGPLVPQGKTVAIHYTGKFLNGETFDSSSKNGQPIEFQVGAVGQVIPGWEEAIPHMKVGQKATLIIPSHLAYGERGIPDPQSGNYIIAPFTPLVFDIEIVSVQ